MVVMGCGKQGPKPGAKADEQKPPEPRNVATGPVEVTTRGKDQKRQWTVRAQASALAFEGEGTLGGSMDNVEGELFLKDAVASKFKALEGKADQESRELELLGEVSVTSEKGKAVLTAQKVRWLEDKGLIEASGGVVVTNPDYKIGPYGKLWATPDLKDIGTPDMFKGWKKP